MELKWDGANKYLKHLDTKEHYTWSSVTLYSEQEAILKASWFDELFEQEKPTQRQVFELHNSSEAQKGFLLEKDDLTRTVSVSQIVVSDLKSTFYYLDLLNKEEITVELNKSII